MQIVRKTDTKEFQNSKTCTVFEYPLEENDINGAVVNLSGRYPIIDRVVNLTCKELAYVIRGTGKLVVEGKEILLSDGDMVLILPNEKYFWEGTMTLLITCTPAWTIEQHHLIP